MIETSAMSRSTAPPKRLPRAARLQETPRAYIGAARAAIGAVLESPVSRLRVGSFLSAGAALLALVLAQPPSPTRRSVSRSSRRRTTVLAKHFGLLVEARPPTCDREARPFSRS